MNILFTDNSEITGLYPLTLTRPAADLRCGILTVSEKWVLGFQQLGIACNIGFHTSHHLKNKFPEISPADIELDGRVMPDAELLKAVAALSENQSIWHKDKCIAKKGTGEKQIQWESTVAMLLRPYHIFSLNAEQIVLDFDLITHGRKSQELSSTNTILGKYPVFAEVGAKVECTILNASAGPIYIGKNAEMMEGSMVRGPFAMGEGSVLKMGAKVYSGTTLGPYCNVGGEVSNVVFWGYSNKGHDGFLGNAVLGEWCNIGADTNCSNLKNTYDEVKVWNYESNRFEKSGLQFCGLLMGDHSKVGINTMFNTGTVVGVACNVFGHGFPRQFIPDFSWGGAAGMVTYKPDAAAKTAALVMPRRKREFNEIEKNILYEVFEISKAWRNWEG